MNTATLSLPLSLAGWFWLPNIATRQLLALYHRFIASRYGNSAIPAQGTVAWQRQYRGAYAIAVLGYLVYNLVDAARSAPPNLFQVLGVTPDADVSLLRNAYRAFAKRYHPDRAGPASESLFIAIRDAYEALKDPVKRFAYERFGPDALKWKDCTTPKEFIWRGLLQSSGFYITSGAVLIFMSLFTKPSPVAFWRYMLFLAMFACELCLVLGHESTILKTFMPDQVPYQHVRGLHQLFVFLSMALSRVIPVVFPEPTVIDEKDPRSYVPFLNRLQQSLQVLNMETNQLLNHEYRVLSGDASSVHVADSTAQNKPQQQQQQEPPHVSKRPVLPPDVSTLLFQEMEDLVLEQLVRVEPPLRQLWDAAVLREREREKRGATTPKAKMTRLLPLTIDVGDVGRDLSTLSISAPGASASAAAAAAVPSPSPPGPDEAANDADVDAEQLPSPLSPVSPEEMLVAELPSPLSPISPA